MHVEIPSPRALAHAHAAFISRAPITTQGTNIDGTHDIVIWTDASAKSPHQQRGGALSGAALVFQTINGSSSNGQVVWQDASFSVTGQRSIHEVELLAVVYALRVGLDVLLAGKTESSESKLRAGSLEDMGAAADQKEGGAEQQSSSGHYGRRRKIRIMSDSQKALRWISSTKPTKKSPVASITRDIQNLVHRIEEGCGYLVEFRWVPGHSVDGNKRADRLAADAARGLRAGQGGEGHKSQGDPYLIWPDKNESFVKRATAELGCVRLGKTCRHKCVSKTHRLSLKNLEPLPYANRALDGDGATMSELQ